MEAPQRSTWLTSVRMYPWEKELVEQASAAEQIRVSEYVRQVLVASARRRVAKGSGQ